MIFVDANIPIYLVGSAHPNQDRTRELIASLTQAGERFVTDIEVYQELLHRYAAIRRPEAIDVAFEALTRLVSDVLPYGLEEVFEAGALLRTTPGVSARDALHVAVMQRAGVTRILSFDRGFDAFPAIERLA